MYSSMKQYHLNKDYSYITYRVLKFTIVLYVCQTLSLSLWGKQIQDETLGFHGIGENWNYGLLDYDIV